MGRALDLRLAGHGFKSYSGQRLCINLGQVVHTYVPLSPSTWYRPRGGDALRLGTGQITTGLDYCWVDDL